MGDQVANEATGGLELLAGGSGGRIDQMVTEQIAIDLIGGLSDQTETLQAPSQGAVHVYIEVAFSIARGCVFHELHPLPAEM
jgi:hypothetical protein